MQNSPMSVSKWSMDFRAGHEVAIAPMWVCFPGLPIPFFQRQQLMQLASTLEHPLKADVATNNLRRPSVMRVLVEMDVSLPLIKQVWIGDEGYGFWQQVDCERNPHIAPFIPCSAIIRSGAFREILPFAQRGRDKHPRSVVRCMLPRLGRKRARRSWTS